MRQCNCSGACAPPTDGLSRREFLERSAAGTAALLTAPVWLAPKAAAADLERWKQSLFDPAQPLVYRSDVHTDARMHLGGIGTGNFEIGADGQCTTWQLFNTLRDGEVPFHFAVKAGAVAKLLQTTGGPEAPHISRIEMTGEYPVARLRFLDGELPVQLEVEAFSPFAPLDTPLSSVPLAAFVFHVTNPTDQPQTISLAALLTNPVGYDALGRIEGDRHPDLGSNVNEPFREGELRGLCFRAHAGAAATLDRPVRLFASLNLAGLTTPPLDRPENLTVELLDRLPTSAGARVASERTLVWVEEPLADFPEPLLRAARDAVQAGATLVLAGTSMPLLGHYAKATGGKPLAQTTTRPDILFEDFEHGYDQWTVTGPAFGPQPPAGTLPNQQRVSGFLGQALVNTYREGDATTGRAVSRGFTIERRFIRFLIGGGSQPNTQLRLRVDGRVVRSASGKDNEKLEPGSWEVTEFDGQQARLEIVDDATGPWGHVNVDHIEFSDQPANRAVLALLEELLPIRFTDATQAPNRGPADPNSVTFANLELRPGAQSTVTTDGLRLFSLALGKGQVVLASGPVLLPEAAARVRARQQAYAVLCPLVGANYRPLEGQHPQAPGFGSLALATLTGECTVAEAVGDWAPAWQAFAKEGRFKSFESAQTTPPTSAGRSLTGALATQMTLPPGSTMAVPFLLTWHFPSKYSPAGTLMGNHYTTRWADARAVLREAAVKFSEWREKTELFRRTFYDSTLPYWLLDGITANAAIIRHVGVVFRIANGDIYGWEGSNGCCQPTCTHVWGYEQSLARLFPELEREMRRIDFRHQQREDGGVNNRTDVPSPPRPTGEQPFADGHASCVLKAYREALNSPDREFFNAYWPPIQRGVEYLIGRDAASHGGQPAGYLEDDQWNTYDEALHGVTTFIGTYYLAALRAGEEWARRMNDTATADRFHSVFTQGQARLVELCWNGEYFQQHLPDYQNRGGEVGPGCMSDQLIGQWWAHQLGLGYLLPRDKVIAALRSVYRYNWKSDLTGWKHLPRAFAGDGDKGLIICTWPKGGRPNNVMLYSDEVWTGIEYQVAAHLVYEGLVEEGLAIVKGARERYDGLPRKPIPRNPWNEIECGGHYARALSSWSLLLALCGWEYDSLDRRLRVGPRYHADDFRCCFVAPEGWGTCAQKIAGGTQRLELLPKWGRLPLQRLTWARAGDRQPTRATVRLGGQTLSAALTLSGDQAELRFAAELVLSPAAGLTVTLA